MYKILIIEDETIISEQISKFLKSWGYDVECVADFSQIMAEFQKSQPHLVLMDILLPSFNGFHWCSEIRKISNVPVIFISSANDNMNIVMAVNMGGDDFISKPFDLNVLYAKIQALLRRTYSFSNDNSNVIIHKNVALNLSDASVSVNGNHTELTKNEFKILSLLFENKGRIVSRTDIMKALWNSDCFIDDNTLTVNINRLRRKLSDAGADNFISTKKGIGYILEE